MSTRRLLFGQLAVWSTCCLVNLPFHQLAISSTCCFINLPFHQLAKSSTCRFINLPFHQLAISSTCPFINLPNQLLAISSTCHFIPLQNHLLISSTYHLIYHLKRAHLTHVIFITTLSNIFTLAELSKLRIFCQLTKWLVDEMFWHHCGWFQKSLKLSFENCSQSTKTTE